MTQVESFEDVAVQKLALVEFFTSWCGPCKTQKRILQDVEDENRDVFVATVDVENAPALADRLKIKSVPTTILFENGKEKGRLDGLQQRDRVEGLIGSTVTA